MLLARTNAAGFSEHLLLVGHDIDDAAAFRRKPARRVEVVRGYAPDDAPVASLRPSGQAPGRHAHRLQQLGLLRAIVGANLPGEPRAQQQRGGQRADADHEQRALQA
jgi:hypothetical protein